VWSRSSVRTVCSSARWLAFWRVLSMRLRSTSGPGAGGRILRLTQFAERTIARGVSKPRSMRRAIDGRDAVCRSRGPPPRSAMPCWRLEKTVHQKAEINSHCVHQPSDSSERSICCMLSNAPSKNEKSSFETTDPQ
jgi:hypothetical protein